MSKNSPFLRWFTKVLLHLSLYALIGSICFVFLIGNKQTLKDTLTDSGIYNNFITSVIKANQSEPTSQNSSVPLDDLKIQDIASSTFSPAVLKEQTEGFIDDMFLWLNGTNDELVFKLDFTSKRDALFDNLSTYAANRLLTLPTCTNENLTQTNVFELPCRPLDTTLLEVKNQVYIDLQNSEFLKNATLTEKNIPNSADGEPLQSKFNMLPSIYTFLENGVVVFSLATFIIVVLYISVRLPRQKALKSLGRDLLTNGLMILAITVIFGFVVPNFTEAYSIQGSETAEVFNQVFDLFIRNLDILIINISLQIVAIGGTILIIERMSRSTNLYGKVSKKSGLSSSYKKKKNVKSGPKKESPPVQTSETKRKVKKKSKKSKKSKKNKYRKIKL